MHFRVFKKLYYIGLFVLLKEIKEIVIINIKTRKVLIAKTMLCGTFLVAFLFIIWKEDM